MNAQIAILAGGRGRRLGGAKATAELGGRPLISHGVDAAVETGLPVFVVAKPGSELPDLGVPVLREPDEPVHPLLGIVTALHSAPGAPLVIAGCDLPFATPALLAWLGVQQDAAIVPRIGGRVHGLVARYAPEVAPALAESLRAGRSVADAVASIGPRYLEEGELAQFGDPERLLFNVNTPEDLAEAERMLERGQAG